jgi:hypothetical protein
VCRTALPRGSVRPNLLSGKEDKMSKAIESSGVIKRLIREGIIPPECRMMTLRCAANEAIKMQLEVYVTAEQMEKIADALIDNAEEVKQFAREIIFNDLDGTGRKRIVELA